MTMINEFFDDLTGEVSSVDPRDENFDSGTEEPINVETELQEIHAQLSDDYLSMESYFASLREINHLRKEIANRNAISREDRISLESAGVTGLPHQNKYTIDYSLSNLKASLEEADKTVISKLKKIKDFFVGLLTKFTNFFKGLVDKFVNFLFRKKKDSAQQEKKQQETQKKAALLLEQAQGEPEEKQASIHKIFREHLAYGLSPLQIKALSHGETVNDEVIEAVKSEVRKIRYGNVLNTLFYDITKEDGKNKQKWLDFTNEMVGELEKANAFRDLMDYHESLTPEDEVDSSKLEPIFVVGSAFEKVAYNSGGRPGNTNDISVLNDAKNRINQLAGMRTKIDNIRDEVSKHRDILKTMYSMLTVDYISSKVDVVHDYKFGNSPKGENSLEVMNVMDRERNTFSAMTSLAFLFASKMSLMYSDIEDCDRDIDFIDAMYDDFKKYSGTVSTENRFTDFIKNIFKRKDKNKSLYQESAELISVIVNKNINVDKKTSDEILGILKQMGISGVEPENLAEYIKDDFLTIHRVPAGSELIAGGKDNYGFVSKTILALHDAVAELAVKVAEPNFFTNINNLYIDGYIDKLKLYDANPSYFGSMPYSKMMEQGVILPADDVDEMALYQHGVDCLHVGDILVEESDFAKKFRIPLEYDYSSYPAKLDAAIFATTKKNAKATIDIETAYKYLDLFNDKAKTVNYKALQNFDIDKFESKVKEHVKFLKTKLPELKELSKVAEKDKLLDQYHKALILSIEYDPSMTVRVARLYMNLSKALQQFHDLSGDGVYRHLQILQMYASAITGVSGYFNTIGAMWQNNHIFNQTIAQQQTLHDIAHQTAIQHGAMGFGMLSHDDTNISMENKFIDWIKKVLIKEKKPLTLKQRYDNAVKKLNDSTGNLKSEHEEEIIKRIEKLTGQRYNRSSFNKLRFFMVNDFQKEINLDVGVSFFDNYRVNKKILDVIFGKLMKPASLLLPDEVCGWASDMLSRRTTSFIDFLLDNRDEIPEMTNVLDEIGADFAMFYNGNSYYLFSPNLNVSTLNNLITEDELVRKTYNLSASKDTKLGLDNGFEKAIKSMSVLNDKTRVNVKDAYDFLYSFDGVYGSEEFNEIIQSRNDLFNKHYRGLFDDIKDFFKEVKRYDEEINSNKELKEYTEELIHVLKTEPEIALRICNIVYQACGVLPMAFAELLPRIEEHISIMEDFAKYSRF